MKDINVQELYKRLQHGEPWFMVDVRQPEEYAICNFEEVLETMLIPLSEIFKASELLPKDRPIVVCCHHGIRSRYAIEVLEQLGFTNLYNLEGGIHAWAMEIDSHMPVY